MVVRLLHTGQSFPFSNSDAQGLTIRLAAMLVLFQEATMNLILSWVRRSGGTVLSPNGTRSCTMFIVSDVFFWLLLIGTYIISSGGHTRAVRMLP